MSMPDWPADVAVVVQCMSKHAHVVMPFTPLHLCALQGPWLLYRSRLRLPA